MSVIRSGSVLDGVQVSVQTSQVLQHQTGRTFLYGAALSRWNRNIIGCSFDLRSGTSAGLQGGFGVVGYYSIWQHHVMHPDLKTLDIHNHWRKSGCKTMNKSFWASQTLKWIFFYQNLIHLIPKHLWSPDEPHDLFIWSHSRGWGANRKSTAWPEEVSTEHALNQLGQRKSVLSML